MKVAAGKFVPRSVAAFAITAVALTGFLAAPQAQAQAPYLLPYSINVLAGGGTSVVITGGKTSPCLGPGITGLQYDSFGDGCPVNSTSVVVGNASDLHDVVVDQQGNVYFLDNSSANGIVRKIDAHSGVISVYAGSYVVQTGFCPATQDKYGDGCPSTDGLANGETISGAGTLVPTPTTSNFGKARGIGIDRNGDVYIADYSANFTHKISAATGLMSAVAGTLASVTKLSSNGGVAGYSGDGAVAFNPSASPTPQGGAVRAPRGITGDVFGNIYFADSGNNVIRKVAAGTGILSTVVGTNPGGGSAAPAAPAPTATVPAALPYMADGDGGPAAGALLNVPEDVEVDTLGNLFIADMGISRIRVVYAGGTVVANLISRTNAGLVPVIGNIYTVMGSGIAANGSTGATTTNAGPVLATSPTVTLGSLRKMAIDARDNIFVADNTNDVIWFLDASTGYMRVIAGTLGLTTGGASCPAHTDAIGDGCPGTAAVLFPNSAMGVAVDAFDNVYISDSGNQRLRKENVNTNFPAIAAGTTSTQILQVHFAAGDTPNIAKTPFVSSNPDYVVTSSVSTSTCTLNLDTTTDCLVTVAFTPSRPGLDNATLTVNSVLNGATGIGLTGTGLAASVAFDPGNDSALTTNLKTPQGVALDAAGNTYIADTANNRVVMIPAAGGTQVTIAGTGTAAYTGDNAAATAATLSGPKAVAVTRSGLIYIADTGNNVIRQVNPLTGLISTVGGAATTVCAVANDALGDGCIGTGATFKAPAGLAADFNGNVYVSDSGNNVIRELTASGYVFAYAGGTTPCNGAGVGNGCSGGGAVFLNPTGLAIDASSNLYIADTGNNEVRELVAATGLVNAVAGNGIAGGSGNGSTATSAQLSGPTGVAIDAAGNVYIADTGNSVIRVVNASGNINTVVGTLGASGTGTLPGSAFAVQLASPAGVASTGTGALVVLDAGNNRAFADNRSSVTYNFGRTNLGFASPSLLIQETSTGSATATLGSPLFSPAPAAPFALGGTASTTCTASQTLTPGAACTLLASFTPSATQLGNFSGTFTETATNTINSPVPFVTLTGVGAVLTTTTSTTVVTNPSTGSPQYPVPFTVTTTVAPASCNTAAPSCFPTGTVTFFVNGTQVGLPVTVSATGTASLTIPGQSVGTYAVTAVYSGDLYYASSSAPALSVAVTTGATTTTVSASPANGAQFSPLTITATVTPVSTVQTTSLPTGTVTFFAGTTQLTWGTAGCGATLGTVTPATGVASIQDVAVAQTKTCPAHTPNSFGLAAGTYALTAVYSGDANYSKSTSAVGTLIIAADPATYSVSLSSPSVGTAQGSTANLVATVTAYNTFSGTVHFTCTNLPVAVTCTFGPPTTLTFTPVPLVPSPQQISITLFTDVAKGVTQTTSGLIGWFALLFSMGSILAFRKRLRANPRALRLLTAVALFGILGGGSIVLSGCSGSNFTTQVTPTGTYTVNLVATSGSQSVTTPITFVVGQGAPGQL